ncbi:hypothetical protein H5410_034884 [Solanum commersonii]|uniref:Uncharacterized protein n=1 Tax=Solanum commersonii TaxID=4109 RepID=A0A9J5Y2Y3_SOLCO|nr:hypothetical protein H5410_034884 [Solanum commersonii]
MTEFWRGSSDGSLRFEEKRSSLGVFFSFSQGYLMLAAMAVLKLFGFYLRKVNLSLPCYLVCSSRMEAFATLRMQVVALSLC